MNTTMREYFRVKGIEMNDLPIVDKSSTGLHELVVYKGGIVSKMDSGNGVVGTPCTWMPDCAKYVNKLLGGKVFNLSPSNLSVQNNNVNELIFERFGDIRVLWVVPDTKKILDNLFSGLNGKYGASCYVGHTTVVQLSDVGDFKEMSGGYDPMYLTSVKVSPEEFKNTLGDMLGSLETALDTEFVKQLLDRLDAEFLGFGPDVLYFKSKRDRILRLYFHVHKHVDEIRANLSYTVKSIVDDCETQRL